MESKLKTRNISIDTNLFESQNFLVGAAISELGELCKEGKINVFLTDITLNEVIARFAKGLKEKEGKFKKPIDSLKSEVRILRNSHEFEGLFNLPNYDIEALTKSFSERLNNWIVECKIELIDTKDLQIGDVFSDYFKEKPPFSSGKKKHEFPDAFILKGLERYFSTKGEQCYFLSSDRDMSEYESTTIIQINEASELIDLILKGVKEKDPELELLLEKINKYFEENQKRFTSQLDKIYSEILYDRLKFNTDVTSIEPNMFIESIDNVYIDYTLTDSYHVIHLDKTRSIIEIRTTISIQADTTLRGFSRGKNDAPGEYTELDITKKVPISLTETVPVAFSMSPSEGNEDFIIELFSMNNGNPFNFHVKLGQ